MANRYWVGGAGTWDASSTTNWSTTSGGTGGASAPTSADDVIINGSSGSGTITASGAVCQSLACTGYTGTLTGGINQISGNITLSSGGTYTGLYLSTQSTGGTLTSAGKTIAGLTTYATTLTCADALTVSDVLEIAGNGGATLKLKNGVTSSCGSFAPPSSGTNYLQSASAGSQATLSDTSGTNTLSYLTVQDIAFTGGATWQLGTGATDAGNNTGLYAAPVSTFDPIFAQSLA